MGSFLLHLELSNLPKESFESESSQELILQESESMLESIKLGIDPSLIINVR